MTFCAADERIVFPVHHKFVGHRSADPEVVHSGLVSLALERLVRPRNRLITVQPWQVSQRVRFLRYGLYR